MIQRLHSITIPGKGASPMHMVGIFLRGNNDATPVASAYAVTNVTPGGSHSWLTLLLEQAGVSVALHGTPDELRQVVQVMANALDHIKTQAEEA